MKINDVTQMIGKTPVIKLKNVVDASGADVYVKLEDRNITGSVKIRPAYYMIKNAIEDGSLKPGMKLVEPTSGNTGIALAYIANAFGYEIALVMPDTMSKERRDIMEGYGAKLVLSDGTKGMKESIAIAQDMVDNQGYVMLQQFENKANVQAHYETTGQEILDDFDKLDAFVAGVGTGGTITGVSQKIKPVYKDIKFIAVQPAESTVLSGGSHSPHKIQGIGAGFVPGILDTSVIDGFKEVDSATAMAFAKELYEKEGLFLGISSAANIKAAIEVAKDMKPGQVVLTVAPDGGDKYLSMDVYK